MSRSSLPALLLAVIFTQSLEWASGAHVGQSPCDAGLGSDGGGDGQDLQSEGMNSPPEDSLEEGLQNLQGAQASDSAGMDSVLDSLGTSMNAVDKANGANQEDEAGRLSSDLKDGDEDDDSDGNGNGDSDGLGNGDSDGNGNGGGKANEDDDEDLDLEDDDEDSDSGLMEDDIVARKRASKKMELGEEANKAKKSAEDSKKKAMSAKHDQRRAQTKAAIAAFRLSQAFKAKQDADEADKLAQEKLEESQQADEDAAKQERAAKMSANKAIKVAKQSGRLFKKAMAKTEKRVSRSVKALEDSQKKKSAAMTKMGGEDQGDAESEQKKQKLQDDAREAMEAAALVKAKADDAAKSLVGVAVIETTTPEAPDESDPCEDLMDKSDRLSPAKDKDDDLEP